jgi:outer membrane protein TolC
MLRWLVAVVVVAFFVGTTASARAQEAGSEVPRPPVVPPVSDPMLAPPEEPRQQIRSLPEAIGLVRSRSPDYASSFETIRRAEAQARQALAGLLPAATGTVTYTHQFEQVQIPFNGATLVTPPPNAWSQALTAAWTPINPHAYHAYGTAKVGIEAAKLSFDDKRRQIASAVVSAMLATLSALHVAELNREGLRTALERLALTKIRLEFGQGTPLDVDRAEQDVAAARRLLIDGDETLKRSREALGVALGSPVPTAVVRDFDVETFERDVARTCHLNDAIEKRPDVAAARTRVAIAERAETDALLLTSPTLGLVGQGGHTDAPVLAPNWTVALEVVLTVPLYDGGLRYGQLRDARAQTRQARAALDTTRLAAVVASAQASRQVEVAHADRDVTQTQRDLAARIDLRTRDSYAHGRGTSLDLVTSAQTLRQAEITLALLEFQLAEARADAVLENAECVY